MTFIWKRRSSLLLAVLLSTAGVVHAQTLLYEFENPPRNPTSQLVQFGDYLYATTPAGGAYDCGAILKIDPVTSSTTVAASFDCGQVGGKPEGALVVSGSYLYGATPEGGSGNGTVYKFDPETGLLTNVVFLSSGSHARGALIVKDSCLYGTDFWGSSGDGRVFKVSLTYGTLTIVATFNGTNGRRPREALVEFDGELYGTTESGGLGYGTIFKVNPATGELTSLHQFASFEAPTGALIVGGGLLYGTTSEGGAGTWGTVFEFNPASLQLSTLASFDLTNGAVPEAGLLLNGSYLYGTTRFAGPGDGDLGYGSVFKVDLLTGALTTMAFFDGANGAEPSSTLVVVGTELFGTTQGGGAGSLGSVFSINAETNALSTLWSANAAGAPFGPVEELVEYGSVLLGVTAEGGANGAGSIFEIDPDGHALTVRASFDASVGASPRGLVRVGSYFYGAVRGFPASAFPPDRGGVFRFDPSTNTLVRFSSFPGTTSTFGGPAESAVVADGTHLYGVAGHGTTGYGMVYKVNLSTGAMEHVATLDAANSYALDSLNLSGSFLYGAAQSSGSGYCGAVFKVNVATGALSTLHSFSNDEGCTPNGGLLFRETSLFGTTWGGAGSSGSGVPIAGTVFRIDPNDGRHNILAPFEYSNTGIIPNGHLIEAGTFLFGTTRYGGPSFRGTVFRLNPESGEIVRLVSFDGNNGSSPTGGLLASGSLLYGTTPRGGSKGGGVVFSVDPNVDPIGQPENVIATGSASAVQLSWDAVAGATYYEIWREGTSAAFFTVAGPAFQDVTVTSNSNYCYRVRAITSRGTSGYGRDFASTMVFADDPLTAGSTPIRGEHITQLRSAINGIRVAIGLPAASFSDASVAGQPVKAVHVQELRTALNEARTYVGLPQMTFTNGTVEALVSVISAADFSELRAATR